MWECGVLFVCPRTACSGLTVFIMLDSNFAASRFSGDQHQLRPRIPRWEPGGAISAIVSIYKPSCLWSFTSYRVLVVCCRSRRALERFRAQELSQPSKMFSEGDGIAKPSLFYNWDGVSRVDEMILARERRGFAGERLVWETYSCKLGLLGGKSKTFWGSGSFGSLKFDSLLLTPLCCDDIHDVTPRVSALAGYDRLISEPLIGYREVVLSDNRDQKMESRITEGASYGTKGDRVVDRSLNARSRHGPA
ncbi:hypothetical protein Tco_0371645 [Tanacetum coccineum]